MTAHRPSDLSTSTPPNRFTSTFVFWMLVLMGFATFTPCVVLPEWRHYQALRIAEQREQHRLDSLNRVVDRERVLLDAFRTDPAVIARQAQRDLSYRRPNEEQISVLVPTFENEEAIAFLPESISPPAFLSRMATYLPEYDYDGLFCDEETRPVLLGMSASLLAIAFLLFGVRPVKPSGFAQRTDAGRNVVR